MPGSIQELCNKLKNSGISQAGIGSRYTGNTISANTPIAAHMLGANSTHIKISPEVAGKVDCIKSTISRQKGTGKINELPFAMLGHKDESGNIVITDIVYNEDEFESRLANSGAGTVENAVADFSGLAQTINKHLMRTDIAKPVVIHGHTHPENPNVDKQATNNFSLHDMNGYQSMQVQTDEKIGKHATVLGMVVNESGDFNTVQFNNSTKRFERCASVSLGNEKLPSYTPGNYFAQKIVLPTTTHSTVIPKNETKPVRYQKPQNKIPETYKELKTTPNAKRPSLFEKFIQSIKNIIGGIFAPLSFSKLTATAMYDKNKVKAMREKMRNGEGPSARREVGVDESIEHDLKESTQRTNAALKEIGILPECEDDGPEPEM